MQGLRPPSKPVDAGEVEGTTCIYFCFKASCMYSTIARCSLAQRGYTLPLGGVVPGKSSKAQS